MLIYLRELLSELIVVQIHHGAIPRVGLASALVFDLFSLLFLLHVGLLFEGMNFFRELDVLDLWHLSREEL